MTKETISIRTKSSIKKEGGTTISVKNIIIHPKYNKSESFDFDIAILELDDSINLDEKSQISNLPDKEPSAGENAKMTGWGHPKVSTQSRDSEFQLLIHSKNVLCVFDRFFEPKFF